MPSAFGIRRRCADSDSTSSVTTYGVAPTKSLGTSSVSRYQTRTSAAMTALTTPCTMAFL